LITGFSWMNFGACGVVEVVVDVVMGGVMYVMVW
jgi:hypothetical protein